MIKTIFYAIVEHAHHGSYHYWFCKEKLGANLFLTKHLASDDFFVFQVAEFMAELVSFWNN